MVESWIFPKYSSNKCKQNGMWRIQLIQSLGLPSQCSTDLSVCVGISNVSCWNKRSVLIGLILLFCCLFICTLGPTWVKLYGVCQIYTENKLVVDGGGRMGAKWVMGSGSCRLPVAEWIHHRDEGQSVRNTSVLSQERCVLTDGSHAVSVAQCINLWNHYVVHFKLL